MKSKKAASRNKMFATRFLYTVNVRFQEFHHLCKLPKKRDDVDDRVLIMNDIIQGVRLGGFSMELPPNAKV